MSQDLEQVPPPYLSLGRALRALREARGVKQTELSARTKIGKSQLSGYESGRKAPTWDRLREILRALGYELFHEFNNALAVAEGRHDQICPGREEEGKEAAAKHLTQGLAILLDDARKRE